MKNNDLRFVVRDRMGLPTNRRACPANFGVNADKVLEESTVAAFWSWDEKKRDAYVKFIGGPVNRKRTLKLLCSIVPPPEGLVLEKEEQA